MAQCRRVGWRDHFEEWKKVGSDEGYHYLGSAIWYTRIGKAMGEAMLELLGGNGVRNEWHFLTCFRPDGIGEPIAQTQHM